MRKGLCFVLVSLFVLPLWMMSATLPAFASTRRATVPQAKLARTIALSPGQRRPQKYLPSYGGGWQVNNQHAGAVAHNSGNRYYRGHDQGNSGNHGYNRGYNEDDSSNAANQVVNRSGIMRYSRNNQYFHIRADNSLNFHYIGYQQGNSGNNGYNSGYNRDNSQNFGNQVIN